MLEKLKLLITTNLKDLDFTQEESENFHWKGTLSPFVSFPLSNDQILPLLPNYTMLQLSQSEVSLM